jgi:molybdopterin synthase catalytic subunit
MYIDIRKEDFQISQELEKFESSSKTDAAISLFIGKVRAEENLISLNLDCYPDMAVREILNIAENAKKKWQIHNLTVIHRFGELLPGENIVFVITSSDHRTDCQEATQYIMDYLKNNAPFWKKEVYKNRSMWVEQKQEDIERMERWED